MVKLIQIHIAKLTKIHLQHKMMANNHKLNLIIFGHTFHLPNTLMPFLN